VACHLARRGYGLRLLDLDGQPLRSDSPLPVDSLPAQEVEGPLLDALAVVTTDEGTVPRITDPAVRERARDGLVVAVLADLDPAHAQLLAGLRRGRATAVALIADTEQWPGPRRTPAAADRLERSVAVLRSHGWRVAVCAPGDDLATAWRGVSRGRGSVAAAVSP
jgi:hypothetical protein